MNRIAVAAGTLVAGTLTVTWKDPDTVDGTAPVPVVLDHIPKIFWVQRITEGAAPGFLRMTVTASGCTITSSNGADVGQVRAYAICRAADMAGG